MLALQSNRREHNHTTPEYCAVVVDSSLGTSKIVGLVAGAYVLDISEHPEQYTIYAFVNIEAKTVLYVRTHFGSACPEYKRSAERRTVSDEEFSYTARARVGC